VAFMILPLPDISRRRFRTWENLLRVRCRMWFLERKEQNVGK